MNNSSAPVDIITIGNGTIDAFLGLHDASLHCRVDTTSCELCIKYGEKIPLDACEFHVGGNAANVAVGLSRGGLHVALVAEIGKDEFATKIINTLTQEGVDLSHLQQQGQSSFAMGLAFQGERTIFVQHQTRIHDFSFVDFSPKLVYLTSIGNTWENAYKKTLHFVNDSQSLLAFNPGTLQIQKGKGAIINELHRADIVFLNKEELEALLGTKDLPVTELLKQARSDMPGLIIVTNGKEGAYAFSKDGMLWYIEGMAATVVEKTGAGDAFATGFIVGFLKQKSIAECLQYGTVNAVSVMDKIGAQPGLLRAEEYMQQIVKAPKVTQL